MLSQLHESFALLQAPKTKDKDGDEATQKKVKEAQKEELDRQSRAQTNQALGAALGGGARWQRFHDRVKPAGGALHHLETCPASCAFFLVVTNTVQSLCQSGKTDSATCVIYGLALYVCWWDVVHKHARKLLYRSKC